MQYFLVYLCSISYFRKKVVMHLRILNWGESSVGKTLDLQCEDLSVIPRMVVCTRNPSTMNNRLFIDDADAEHKYQT